MEDALSYGDILPPERDGPLSDKARAAAAAAARLQRKQRLEALIAKRRTNFAYMKKIHEGKSYWLNSVSMTGTDINNFLVLNDDAWGRLVPFFYLGVSMARTLQRAAGMEAIQDVLQLFEEWEYHFSSFSVQSVKYVMARSLPTAYPGPVEDNEPTSPSSHYAINKFNNEVVYSKLLCPHVSFELNYAAVVHALCDVLVKLYEKIFSAYVYTWRYSNIGAYDAAMRLDHKIKHFIISPLSKDLTEDATRRVKSAFSGLRK